MPMNEDGLATRFIDTQSTVTELDPDFVKPEQSKPKPDAENLSGNKSENGDGHGYAPPPVDVRQKDSAGDYYDSSIHLTDENGKPVLTKTGKFRKRPGRKTSGTSAGNNPKEQAVRMSCREAGKVSSEAIFLFGQTVFGEEWKPVIDGEHGINEPEQMTTAFAAYYEATGFRDPPPWLILVIGIGAYAGPRLAAPKTGGKLKRFSEWIGLHAMGWRKKKTPKKDDK